MKISSTTKIILENFAKISSSMYFNAGKKQKVMTPGKSVVAEVEIKEEIPQDFGILHMDKFLSVMSFFEEPEIEFGDKNLTVTDGKNTKVVFWYTEKSLLGNVPPIDKSLDMSNPELVFEMSKDDLEFIMKTSAALSLQNFVIEGDGSNIYLTVKDVDSSTSNKSSRKVGETTDTFQYVGDVSNLRMIRDDYEVSVKKSGIIQFIGKSDMKLKYWVAIRS